METASLPMEKLSLQDRYRQRGVVVLDVRTSVEYRRGHVPGSANVPVRQIEASPARFRHWLEGFDQVYLHCSSGPRAKRAYDALTRAGLANHVHVSGGMRDWVRRRYPVEREISLARDLATGLAAGLVAMAAAAGMDKLLAPLVSDEQKRRERAVREGSPHKVGGAKIGERVSGKHFSAGERRKAQMAFTVGYGLLWGAIYAVVRRRLPLATSLYGAPFAVAFFLACDGALAPLFRLSPGLRRIPWQFNAKELANHAAWTATAEAVHRIVERRA